MLIPLIGSDLEDALQLQGKDFAEFASDICLDLRARSRLFSLASGAPSGKSLKFWDLPYVRRLCDVTGPLHMCAWFLQQSSCLPGHCRAKATRWLVSTDLFLSERDAVGPPFLRRCDFSGF